MGLHVYLARTVSLLSNFPAMHQQPLQPASQALTKLVETGLGGGASAPNQNGA